MSKPVFIMEAPIYQEPKIVKNKPNKAIFRCTIQSVDTINKNNRLYPRAVLKESLHAADPRIKNRGLTGELDHPCPTSDDNFNMARQSVVSLEKVCHLIRDYEFRGNLIVAEMETLLTPNGSILLGLLRDNVSVGFSLRGLASLEKKTNYNEVIGPMHLISYDAVSTPSHAEAVVNFNEVNFMESINLLKESLDGKTICTSDGVCYLTEYFDKLVEQKIVKFTKRWV